MHLHSIIVKFRTLRSERDSAEQTLSMKGFFCKKFAWLSLMLVNLLFFLQDNARMADFVIQDSLNKHDKDKDGQISKKEFLGEKIVFNLREAKGSFRLQEIFFRQYLFCSWEVPKDLPRPCWALFVPFRFLPYKGHERDVRLVSSQHSHIHFKIFHIHNTSATRYLTWLVPSPCHIR